MGELILDAMTYVFVPLIVLGLIPAYFENRRERERVEAEWAARAARAAPDGGPERYPKKTSASA